MLRLLLWSLIWINSTATSDKYPLVLFPEHLNKHPYFSTNYAKGNNIKEILIYTSVKFPDRPIYKLSQYSKLHFTSSGQLSNKQVIFEALSDTLETVISWNGNEYPGYLLENTGRQWEYYVMEWRDGYPSKIDFDTYYDRNASTIEALQVLGNNFNSHTYWSRSVKGDQLDFVLHEKLGTPLGQLQLTPYYKPTNFFYNDNFERRSYRYKYRFMEDGKISEIRHGGRLNIKRHQLSYDKYGRIKGVKSYENDELLILTDYFYNEEGTLRSFLITNMRSKEMTIKEFRYSFY